MSTMQSPSANKRSRTSETRESGKGDGTGLSVEIQAGNCNAWLTYEIAKDGEGEAASICIRGEAPPEELARRMEDIYQEILGSRLSDGAAVVIVNMDFKWIPLDPFITTESAKMVFRRHKLWYVDGFLVDACVMRELRAHPGMTWCVIGAHGVFPNVTCTREYITDLEFGDFAGFQYRLRLLPGLSPEDVSAVTRSAINLLDAEIRLQLPAAPRVDEKVRFIINNNTGRLLDMDLMMWLVRAKVGPNDTVKIRPE
jgi:hypothetical protein